MDKNTEARLHNMYANLEPKDKRAYPTFGAFKNAKRLAYGTRSKQWHKIGPLDRDWEYALTFEEFYQLGYLAAKEKYLSPSIIRN